MAPRRKQKARARERYRTDSRLQDKKMSSKLLMPIPFCWPQLDDVDWFKMLLNLLGNEVIKGPAGLEEPTQDNMVAFVL